MTVNSVLFVLNPEHVLLYQLVEVKIYAFLRNALYDIGNHTLVKSTNTLLPPGSNYHISSSPVLGSLFLTHELVLLETSAHCCERVQQEHRYYLRNSPANKVFLRKAGLRHTQSIIEYLGAFINVHLSGS